MATLHWYGPEVEGQWSGTAARRVDWMADTIKLMLTTSGYSPDQDADTFRDDVTNEVSGVGYAAVTLTGKSLTYNAGTNKLHLDADDVSWPGASFTARCCVIYKDTGSDATSPLLGYADFGSDQTATSANFDIEFDAEGVLVVDVP